MQAYPLCVVGLDRRRCVVVGGGAVAERKVLALLDAAARVTVISPRLCSPLAEWAQAGRIAAELRPYRDGDLEGAFLAIAATADPEVNQAVWREAERRGCLVNVVDEPAHSSFILPAVVRRGDLTIAVSTGGASPALARRLREQIEAAYGPEYEDLVRLLAELRPEMQSRLADAGTRAALALQLVDADLPALLRQEGWEAAHARAIDIMNGDTPL